ncbi:hypothetical protein THAOC_34248, partial [Thalassiosira oceanica]
MWLLTESQASPLVAVGPDRKDSVLSTAELLLTGGRVKPALVLAPGSPARFATWVTCLVLQFSIITTRKGSGQGRLGRSPSLSKTGSGDGMADVDNLVTVRGLTVRHVGGNLLEAILESNGLEKVQVIRASDEDEDFENGIGIVSEATHQKQFFLIFSSSKLDILSVFQCLDTLKMFYDIPNIRTTIAVRQLSFIGKDLPTRLMITAHCNHTKRSSGWPQSHNKDTLVSNLLPTFDVRENR